MHANSPSAPHNLQNIRALFGDGPHINSPLTAQLADANGLACSPLAAGSLAGAIALIQRGTCVFSDKINNAQNAGAVAVILYQQTGIETVFSSLERPDGNPGGYDRLFGWQLRSKSFIDANQGVTVSLDAALTSADAGGLTEYGCAFLVAWTFDWKLRGNSYACDQARSGCSGRRNLHRRAKRLILLATVATQPVMRL